MTGKDDVSHSTWFQTLSDRVGGPSTRAATGYLNVEPPVPGNSEVRRNFFSQRVVAAWSSLPDNIKKSETVNSFKNSLADFKACRHEISSKPSADANFMCFKFPQIKKRILTKKSLNCN